MSMTVKAYLKRGENANAEIRRFVIDESVTSSFEYLSKKVAQVFPSLGNPDNFSLSWRDAEGDHITFSSDEELMEALGQLNEDIFRVYVKEKKKGRHEGHGQTSTSGPNPNKGAEEEVYHPGVICDGCENRIRGPRFKCVTCPDYDLCKQCEARGLHPEHSFVKFRKPQVGRSHHGGFFHRPGMFRQFGHPGWRHWWSCNQQQQQSQSQDQGQNEGPGPSTQNESFQGAGAAPGPHGDGPFPPPPPPPHHPHMPPPPPPHVFLRDIGETVAQMLDPLGIDVDIDIDHNGQQSHCAGGAKVCGGRGKHGRRHGGRGRRGCRNTWAGNEQTMMDESQEPASSGDKKSQENGGDEGSTQNNEQGAPQKQGEGSGKDKAAAEPMEMSETGGGAGTSGGASSSASGSGSDDADWTMLEDGQGKATPPPQQGTEDGFQHQNALNQMQAMGFDNEGGWLASLLEAKGGDIGRVLDAIKIGNQPSFKVNMK